MTKKVKWAGVEDLIDGIVSLAEDEICLWMEDDTGALKAGTRSPRSGPAREVSVPLPKVFCNAFACGPQAEKWLNFFVEAFQRELEHLETVSDMAGTVARGWRQTNALLKMTATTNLETEPQGAVENIIAVLKRSTRFYGGAGVIRLPRLKAYTLFDGSEARSLESDDIELLDKTAVEIRVLSDEDHGSGALALCESLTGSCGEVVVGRLASGGSQLGYLLAWTGTSGAPTSDDLKIFGSACQILSVAVENLHTLERERETTRQHVETELYQTIAKTAPVGIFRTDDHGRCVYVNERWCEITGLAPEAAMGDGWQDGLCVEDRDIVVSQWTDAVRDGSAFRAEYRFEHPDGEMSWVMGQAVPEQDRQGAVRGYVGALTDITDRKIAEQEKEKLESQLRQSQKMEAIGVLAGGIAHDFNNILGAIIGNTELAQNKLADEDRAQKNLQRILRGCSRAKDLVRQILTFSRKADAGREAVDVGSVVDEALDLVRASVPATIEIHKDIQPDCGTVLADSTQLHQVLINLCTNAHHAMGEEGGVLRVSLARVVLDAVSVPTDTELKAGAYVKIAVSDTGHGMDEATRSKIFDPFYTTKAPDKGTGMGLSVVHGIVASHGGAMEVESEVGAGTTFNVYLPISVQTTEESVAPVVAPQRPKSCRVLLVDGEVEPADTAIEILTRLGHRITVLAGCEEALSALRTAPQSYDVVIFAYPAAGCSGAEFVKSLLALHCDLPVVLATDAAHALSDEKAAERGFFAQVGKPYEVRGLARAVYKASFAGKDPAVSEDARAAGTGA
ncbi:MAG: ATP-binding protein [Candidatus Binatia bacterium]